MPETDPSKPPKPTPLEPLPIAEMLADAEKAWIFTRSRPSPILATMLGTLASHVQALATEIERLKATTKNVITLAPRYPSVCDYGPIEEPMDVARMQMALQSYGYDASDRDIHWAWCEYSGSLSASWLVVPESGEFIAARLGEYLIAPNHGLLRVSPDRAALAARIVDGLEAAQAYSVDQINDARWINERFRQINLTARDSGDAARRACIEWVERVLGEPGAVMSATPPVPFNRFAWTVIAREHRDDVSDIRAALGKVPGDARLVSIMLDNDLSYLDVVLRFERGKEASGKEASDAG
jgi:hypothetical protein